LLYWCWIAYICMVMILQMLSIRMLLDSCTSQSNIKINFFQYFVRLCGGMYCWLSCWITKLCLYSLYKIGSKFPKKYKYNWETSDCSQQILLYHLLNLAQFTFDSPSLFIFEKWPSSFLKSLWLKSFWTIKVEILYLTDDGVIQLP